MPAIRPQSPKNPLRMRVLIEGIHVPIGSVIVNYIGGNAHCWKLSDERQVAYPYEYCWIDREGTVLGSTFQHIAEPLPKSTIQEVFLLVPSIEAARELPGWVAIPEKPSIEINHALR